MLSWLPALLAPILAIAVLSFLIYRFGFFSGREVGGRFAFVSGGLLVVIVAAWQVVELVPEYPNWFVPGAYAIVDFIAFMVGALGLLLVVIGLALYLDHWQVRREEIEERSSRLSILENLHHDARQPYHLLELLNISLREILVHYPLGAGAVFLVNRSRRQFVLTGSTGLRKEEVAYLEYYPLERNIVSQAVELGDPMLVSRFDFIDRTGQQIASRFHSVLILPLMSGLEKIGCLILFSEDREFFAPHDIRCLMPVAQWLAEKIKTARLGRELAQTEKRRDESNQQLSDLIGRFSSSARAASSPEAIDGFCRGLVGMVDSESVHLCSVEQNQLVFLGGSEQLFDLSENFRTALVDGMGRAKPLIINQESSGSEAERSVVQSSLIYPLATDTGKAAMLFIRSGRPFTVDDSSLKLIESLANLARLIVKVEEQQRSRLTRRKGFDAVLKLLNSELTSGEPHADLVGFLDTLLAALPRRSPGVVFVADAEQIFKPIHGAGLNDRSVLDSLEIYRDEGGLGIVSENGASLVIYGRGKIAKHLETFHDQSRVAFQHLFGERGLPDFLGYCPITTRDSSLAVAMFGIYGVAETDKGEWERLITLAAGLFSLRLTMHNLAEAAQKAEQAPTKIDAPAEFLNRLNNLLSAVIGTAELVAQKDDLPVETANQIQQIIDKAEEAAAIGRESLIASVGSNNPQTEMPGELNRIIESELARHHVSGDIYMAGQRPREVRLNLSPVGPTEFSDEKVQQLFRSALNRFAASAAETDVLSIATYARDNYVYLDVSRHGSNFPAVEKVAGFGRYVQSSEAFRNRPGDIYLRHLDETDSYYAVDTGGTAPAFLSFKFPARTGSDQADTRPTKAKVKLLAIDDQSVILDLISAMGHSLGYQVETAATGEAGVELAELSQFDVILADLSLPGISGLEVAKRISQRQPSVPIVLVTGWATEIEPDELEAAGIVKVLYKPFRIEQLTNVVQSVVSSRVSF